MGGRVKRIYSCHVIMLKLSSASNALLSSGLKDGLGFALSFNLSCRSMIPSSGLNKSTRVNCLVLCPSHYLTLRSRITGRSEHKRRCDVV